MRQRSHFIADRINALGEATEREGLIRDDRSFVRRVKSRMGVLGVSEASAVFVEALLDRAERSEATSDFITRLHGGEASLAGGDLDPAFGALLEYFLN